MRKGMKLLLLLGALVLAALAAAMILSEESEARVGVSNRFVGNTEIQISWSPYSSTNYSRTQLYRNDALIETFYSTSWVTYRDTGLNQNEGYYYKVEYYKEGNDDPYDDGESAVATTGEVRGVVIFPTQLTKDDGPYSLVSDLEIGEGGSITLGNEVSISSQVDDGGGNILQCLVHVSNRAVSDISITNVGLVYRDVANAEITSSHFLMGEKSAQRGPALRFYDCGAVKLKGNWFDNYDYRAAVAFGDDFEQPSSVGVNIEENYFVNCQLGVLGQGLTHANFKRNSFMYNSGDMLLRHGSRDIDIHDNTFIDTRSESVIIYDKSYGHDPGDSMNHSFRNNKFRNCTSAMAVTGDSVFIHNNTIWDFTAGNAIMVVGNDSQIIGNHIEGHHEEFSGSGIEYNGRKGNIEDNNISYVHKGISLAFDAGAHNSTVKENRVSHCGLFGIIIERHFSWGNIIHKNNVTNCGGDGQIGEDVGGIGMKGGGNNEIVGNNVSDSDGNGIVVYSGQEFRKGNEIRANELINNSHSGIAMEAYYRPISHMKIQLNTILKSGRYGIYARGFQYFSYSRLENSTVEWNTIRESGRSGLYLRGVSNNSIKANQVLGSQQHGIHLDTDRPAGWGPFKPFHNKLDDNTITITDHQRYYEIKSMNYAQHGHFENNTVGTNYPTKISVKNMWYKPISIRGVEKPPEVPRPPQYPAEHANISNFVEVVYDNPFAFDLLFHYNYAQLNGLSFEETKALRAWKYNDSGWDPGLEFPAWGFNHPVDTSAMAVSVRVDRLGTDDIFAPLIAMPVHNLDTEKHFSTITAAILDFETKDGHTITVDRLYTQNQVKESIVLSKALTIRPSTGGPAENVIETNFPSLDVILVTADGASISGFTIKGSTSKRGVHLFQNSDFTLENCVISDNYNGFLRVENGSRASPGDLTITGCSFENNKNVGVVVDGPGGTVIENSVFRNMEYGIALQQLSGGEVKGCTFEGMKTAAVYILEGSGHTVSGNTITGNVDSGTGLWVQLSADNEIDGNTLTGLDVGILLEESGDCSVTGNGFSQIRDVGIRLEDSNENRLKANSVETAGTGILLEGSDENTLIDLTITGTGTTDMVGLDLMGSKDNSLEAIELSALSAAGRSVTGIRLAAGSNGNSLVDSEVKDLESSMSRGLFLGSSLNEIHRLGVSNIESHGQESSTGVFILPHANGNLLVDVTVSTVEGPVNSTGFYLDTNSHNNLSKCRADNVTAEKGSGVGLKLNNTGPAYFNDSLVRDNEIGILCENGSALETHWTTIEGNTVHGLWNKDPSVTINAENCYWGVKSGPSGEGPGTGDKVSLHVDFDPWTGVSTGGGRRENDLQPGTGTVDEKGTADTVVDYDTGVPVTVSTLKYDENPGGDFDGDLGKYIDVQINASYGVNELTVKMYYTAAELDGRDEAKLKMYWHDGSKWKECSETGVVTDDTGGYAGYVWATIRADTSPSLSQMIGTPFGAEIEEEGGEDDDDNDGKGLGIAIGVILGLLIVAGLVYTSGVIPAMLETEDKDDSPKSVSGEGPAEKQKPEEEPATAPAGEPGEKALDGESS